MAHRSDIAVQRCITVFVTHDTLTAVTASNNTVRCTDAAAGTGNVEWIHGRASYFMPAQPAMSKEALVRG
jgi:hypothetical protein